MPKVKKRVKKTKRIKPALTRPLVTVLKNKPDNATGFPVEHLSSSALIKFGENPMLFKMLYVQGETFETANSVASVLGKGFHKAMEAYYGGNDDHIVSDEQDAIKAGLTVGTEWLTMYNDGFIRYSEAIPNKTKLLEKFSYLFTAYIKEMPYDNGEELIACEKKMEHLVHMQWRNKTLTMPVPLKGYADKLFRKDGKLKIKDYKTTASFSDLERIDGAKIIQAVTYYLLAFAETGEEPYSMVYEEAKHTKNKDGGSQVRSYEMVFAENELYFDFFFRYYSDVVRALNGEQVYVPNVHSLFDNEVAIIAYIHRLDEDTEVAKQMKKHRVDNITDLLKKKVQNAKNMKRFLEAVERQLTTAKNIDYSKMETHDKIRTKLMEHGMVLDFDSKIEGNTVDLYRYTPSIGLKMARLASYTADIEQVLGASGIRVLAPIQGTTLVGFEVPRKQRVFPGQAPKARDLVIPIGINVQGEVAYVDMKTAPHLLIAGTTGAGKSVTMTEILGSVGSTADLWLMDPKAVELNDIPAKHYADDTVGIMKMLKELTKLMDERYQRMKKEKKKEWTGRRIIAVVDEYADLVLQSTEGLEEYELCEKHQAWDDRNDGKIKVLLKTKRRLRVKEQEIVDEVTYCNDCQKHVFPPASESIQRLAQKGRAAGVHLIIATQRPSVKVVTGEIKANFPTRIALRTASAIDSEIVLDQKGAEKLLGKGDMLLKDASGITRLQGYKS